MCLLVVHFSWKHHEMAFLISLKSSIVPFDVWQADLVKLLRWLYLAFIALPRVSMSSTFQWVPVNLLPLLRLAVLCLCTFRMGKKFNFTCIKKRTPGCTGSVRFLFCEKQLCGKSSMGQTARCLNACAHEHELYRIKDQGQRNVHFSVQCCTYKREPWFDKIGIQDRSKYMTVLELSVIFHACILKRGTRCISDTWAFFLKQIPIFFYLGNFLLICICIICACV